MFRVPFRGPMSVRFRAGACRGFGTGLLSDRLLPSPPYAPRRQGVMAPERRAALSASRSPENSLYGERRSRSNSADKETGMEGQQTGDVGPRSLWFNPHEGEAVAVC